MAGLILIKCNTSIEILGLRRYENEFKYFLSACSLQCPILRNRIGHPN
jgi:hypothetical protein